MRDRKRHEVSQMTSNLNELLKNKAINKWKLFRLISIPISIIMIVAMLLIDSWDGPAVSSMIGLSVRWAVPWMYLAFAASSIQILFPGAFSNWLLRNRKIMGLCFAGAMAWQLFFILWLVMGYTEHYIDGFVLRDAIEGVVGYMFLAAMTLTSFNFGRKYLQPKSWRLLHKSGIYFVWAYAFSVYWWAIFYYPNPANIDYVYYWAGFLVWGLRAAAWHKKRWIQAEKSAAHLHQQPVLKFMGYVVVGFGTLAASLGSVWRAGAEEILYGYPITYLPEQFLPYWPFEPFLPLLVIACGVCLIARFRASNDDSIYCETMA